MMLGSCRNVEEFEKINRIGEGTYGTVYKAKDKRSGAIVALKRVILHNEKQDGFPITAIREVKLLKRLNHPHCVKLLGIAAGRGRESVFLVFEYCEHDLALLIDSMPRQFSESEVKQVLLQLLSAVEYLHNEYIIHRDLKLSNLLYNSRGELKLADFGLAREFGIPIHPMTPKVVTLWYRAPELLLGCGTYTTAIDMWACGCIFGELLKHKPLLPGKTDAEQLQLMFKLLGTANKRIWPEISSLPNAKLLNFDHSNFLFNNLTKEFPCLSHEGIDLLNKMLTYDPEKRITAREAMNHPYFREKPYPKDKGMMPTFPTLHTRNSAPKRHANHTTAGSGDSSRFGSIFGANQGEKRQKLSN